MRENRHAARLRVAKNVKRLRELRRLSQERLAELAGTTNKTVSEVELGKTNATIDKLEAIADGLSVNLVELFREPRPVRSGLRTLLFTEGELEQIEQALTMIVRKNRRASTQD
jgi:transcriptional regulator with XRE-family HTH domain